MGSKGKLEEAEKLLKQANKLWAPSLLDLRLKPDWEGAAPLYEKAALAFRVGSTASACANASACMRWRLLAGLGGRDAKWESRARLKTHTHTHPAASRQPGAGARRLRARGAVAGAHRQRVARG